MNDEHIFLYDRTSLDMPVVLSRHEDLFDRDYRRPVMQIRKWFIRDIPKASSGREAIELIERYLQKIEQALATIIKTHSSYFWLFLLRRILPVSSDGHDMWSTSLARTIAELAIVKYALKHGPDMTKEFVIEKGQYQLKDAGYFEYIAAYQIEYLGFEYWRLTAVARSVWKGASLVVRGQRFGSDMSDELDFLIKSIDSRVPGQPLLNQIASVEDLLSADLTDQEKQSSIVLFLLNSQKIPFKVFGEGESYTPNFLPLVVSTSRIVKAFQPFDQALIEAGMASSAEMGIFLEAIWLRSSLMWFGGADDPRVRLSVMYQFMQRAYWISGVSPDELPGDIAHAYLLAHPEADHGNVTDVVSKCTTQFTYMPETVAKIDLWDRAPMRFIWQLDEGKTLVDFARIPEALYDLTKILGSASGATGTLKGYRLEENLEGLVRSWPSVVPWVCRDVIIDCNGHRKEIDVSFISGHVLVIVEWKALLRSRLIDRGEIVTLRRRWDDLVGFIDDAESKARLVRDCPNGRNYSLPSDITHIAAIVCTSDAEYIHTRESRFWLTDAIPRICTSAEIQNLVESGFDWSVTPDTIGIEPA